MCFEEKRFGFFKKYFGEGFKLKGYILLGVFIDEKW